MVKRLWNERVLKRGHGVEQAAKGVASERRLTALGGGDGFVWCAEMWRRLLC